jgi:serine/threonine-protein phosphatase 4 regulatory subunit 1
LGPFIATYEGTDPSPVLLDLYLNMYEQNKSKDAENEVPYYCAFNIPAVVYTYGPKCWPKIKPLYETLSKDNRWKVRRTLAFSLHELARMLGGEITENELIPIMFGFMKDVPDVREGVM